MIRYVAVASACLVLAACNQGEAPKGDGICWQSSSAPSGPPKFTQLAQGVGSLEDCAVLLEAARLQGQPNTNGAYQGFFLFVDASGMTSGSRKDGFRYPVLQPPQRADVDRDLRKIMDEHGGKLPPGVGVSIERNPP